MPEPYESIGNRVMRHFRHVIDSTVHYWLQGNRLELGGSSGQVSLVGSVSDDGLPNPPATVTTNWTVVSGPGSASFGNANALQTSVTFDTPGNYVLRLTADDGEFSRTDDVAVTVTTTGLSDVPSGVSTKSPLLSNDAVSFEESDVVTS